jgi:flagellar protein FlaG
MESQPIGSAAAVAAPQSATRPPVPDSAKPRDVTSEAGSVVEAKQEAVKPQRDPRSLQYQVDITTHRVIATIVDEGSLKVIRQIPDEEVIRIAKAIDRMQGFLVHEKA